MTKYWNIILILIFFSGIFMSIIVSDHHHPSPINHKIEIPNDNPKQQTKSNNVVTVHFPSDKYPTVADHIKDAISAGKPSNCTIDRKGAKKNREESLKNTPTKKGYDRDEFPMAMCEEGGKGADIRYIKPKENRGAGSWFSNKVEKYPNGTKIKIEVD
ncbi:NucA/NucB deoxyribonuclease domain-containing protein [Shimazuella alba]|nr:NucA/NucB deoxyribonuclease domain-containing protein [Shimazuella alba]